MIEQEPRWSYLKHQAHDQILMEDKTPPSCYTAPDSIDAWRHMRMHNTIFPLLKAYPDASWLTVGDGKYGSDAYFLKCSKIDVTASSLSNLTLNWAKEHGYLDKIQVQNAEGIDAKDNLYDFVLCKEAYHHFPRPHIAFYEMLRVSRRGVVLIEPIEGSQKILDYLKVLGKKITRKGENIPFEPSGNFIYKVNIREICKMMTALNYELVAYKKLNDFYHPKLSRKIFCSSSLATLTTIFGITLQDILCFLGLMNYGLGTIVSFKKSPSEEVLTDLKEAGFQHIHLPINPYKK